MTLTAASPGVAGQSFSGHIAQIIGPVVDVAFPPEHLPEIYFALELDLSQMVGTGDGAAAATTGKRSRRRHSRRFGVSDVAPVTGIPTKRVRAPSSARSR